MYLPRKELLQYFELLFKNMVFHITNYPLVLREKEFIIQWQYILQSQLTC